MKNNIKNNIYIFFSSLRIEDIIEYYLKKNKDIER